MTQKLLNQYEGLPLLPGVKSDYTRPLILELIDKGNGEAVFKLLHSIGLEVKESSNKSGFVIFTKINGRNIK